MLRRLVEGTIHAVCTAPVRPTSLANKPTSTQAFPVGDLLACLSVCQAGEAPVACWSGALEGMKVTSREEPPRSRVPTVSRPMSKAFPAAVADSPEAASPREAAGLPCTTTGAGKAEGTRYPVHAWPHACALSNTVHALVGTP